MNKLLLIFDYFKEAFHTNKENKALYKPQIAFILLKVLLIITVSIGVYLWIGIDNINALAQMNSREIFDFFLNQGFKLVALVFLYGLVSVVIEAGLLNMYKKAVTEGYTISGDFKEGLSKYFFKLLLGEILIMLCYLLAFPFYLLAGIITLTVGFTVIPIAAGIFLSMWKISLVMNDTGFFAAIKDSFSFAKRNFMPLAVLHLIHKAFIGGGRSGSSSTNFRFPDSSSFQNGFNNQIVNMPGMEEAIKFIKLATAIMIPIVTIATITVSVIIMIFEVFFSLVMFIAYKHGFRLTEPTEAISQEQAMVSLYETESIDYSENEEVESREVEQ